MVLGLELHPGDVGRVPPDSARPSSCKESLKHGRRENTSTVGTWPQVPVVFYVIIGAWPRCLNSSRVQDAWGDGGVASDDSCMHRHSYLL